MKISELNVRRYIKEQTKNIAFSNGKEVFYISSSGKPNHIDFNSIYNSYNNFKKFGKDLFESHEGNINKIEFHNNKLNFNWPLYESSSYKSNLIQFLTTKHNFNNEQLGLDKIHQAEINSFAELIYLCSDSIKNFCTNYAKEIGVEDTFKRIISIYENDIEHSFDYKDLEKIIDIVEYIENNHNNLSEVKELLIYDNDVILPWLKYNNGLSIYFHFFKLEIVYYSHILIGDTKPQLCTGCNRYTNNCKCMTLTQTEKRRINRECVELRKELDVLVSKNMERISSVHYREARKLIDGSHSHKHLNRLKELIEIINEQIKGS